MAILSAAGTDAAVEGYIEGVQRGFPSVGPALAAFAGGVEAEHGEVEYFERGLVVGEVAAGVGRTAESGVEVTMALVVQMILRISVS